jgi:hypothetical protein
LRKQHYWLAALAVVCAILSLISHIREWPWFDSICSNLCAGFLGAFLTVLLVDRALGLEREAHSLRLRSHALEQLRPSLAAHASLLWGWYKASVRQLPARSLKTVTDLFPEDYYEEIRYLDFSKPGPVFPPMDWFTWSAREFEIFRKELRRIEDAYAPLIELETITLLEQMASTTLINLVPQLPVIRTSDAQTGFQHAYNVLGADGSEQLMREHIVVFSRLVDHFNASVRRPLNIEQLQLGRSDIAPTIGSSRIAYEGAPASGKSVS